MNEKNYPTFFNPLIGIVSKLDFNDEIITGQAVINPSYGPENDLYNVYVTTLCNGKNLKEFTLEIRSVTRVIEDKIETEHAQIKATIKYLNRLKEEIYTYDGKYIGEVKRPLPPNKDLLKNKYDETSNGIITYGLNSIILKTKRSEFYDVIGNTLIQFETRLRDLLHLNPYSPDIEAQSISNNRIKWLGSNALLGHLISTLEEYQLIELPMHNGGDIHYPDTAKLILSCFETKRQPKSLESFEKSLNPRSNGLTNKSREIVDELIKEINKMN